MTVKPTLKALEKAFDGDKDLLLFFLSWLKNNQNATKAYQELHPGTDYSTASTLGSRLLKKVDISAVLSAYDLTPDAYFTQLKEGLNANRTISAIGGKEADGGTVDFIDVPDHKTRKDYHDKLGKLLGYEVASNSVLNVDARTQIIINPEQEKQIQEEYSQLMRLKELVIKRNGTLEKAIDALEIETDEYK